MKLLQMMIYIYIYNNINKTLRMLRTKYGFADDNFPYNHYRYSNGDWFSWKFSDLFTNGLFVDDWWRIEPSHIRVQFSRSVRLARYSWTKINKWTLLNLIQINFKYYLFERDNICRMVCRFNDEILTFGYSFEKHWISLLGAWRQWARTGASCDLINLCLWPHGTGCLPVP